MSDNNYYGIQPRSAPQQKKQTTSTKQSQEAQQQPPWSISSIFAVVLPFLCMWPIAFICGVIGLYATREGKKRGRPLAVIGLVLSTIMLLLTIVGAVTDDPAAHKAERAQQRADQLEKEIDADIAAGR